ncbi:xanthine dehydrogenase family protein molybdopterin-binding subunit [Pedobacter sandarakinus]|uniref:xanthine dehydrogenase family protein molybdopterin-binding subunit n=1 Tax=Pedobacter sandarakinus TaxID=353156 RepID=UPI0022468D09|nr:xanthine dehydrogenase family protein molybdopterin-binding subunit [Pedobacter sandarakinus]MCX2575087.1 xanthine dehydrogenase family protein molybdopterin-binding subunit [Pedobacter sandarakinus]
MDTNKTVGKPLSRLEGRAKVTGAAKYAAEHQAPDLLHGYIVGSAITKGKIADIDITKAMAIPGVVEVLSHLNRPKLASFDLQYTDMDAPPGTVFKPLHNEQILFNGQPIALVVASDFETARYAATQIVITYTEEAHKASLEDHLDSSREPQKGFATALKPPPPPPTGDFETAFENAAVKVSATYHHGTEHHNPIELFATTTLFEGDGKLTIYDKTQGTINNQLFVANVFGLHYKDVRVLAPFVGGGFGSGLRPQYQLFLCAMAALHLKRNVRVVLDRKQMFSFSHRPTAVQQLRFATDINGKLTAMGHSTFAETSSFEDYTEPTSNWSHKLYPAPNTLFEHEVVPLDVPTPMDMRAPGGSTALHAIECTMDELAYKLKIDPLELRLINYSDFDPSTKKPYTSKALRECYLQAAEKFGWYERSPEPRSMKRGNKLIGYGMATGIWDAFQFPARAKVLIDATGKMVVENATTDIGTGTLTVMTQIAADELGLSIDDVDFRYGDSKKPFSMFQGGSAITSSTGVAIVVAAKALRKKLLKKAGQMEGSPFKKAEEQDVLFMQGKLILKEDPSKMVSLKDIIAFNKGVAIQTTQMGKPHMLKLRKYSLATHSASFVEVEVDRDLGTVKVTRAVTAVAAGKIINPKTAKSQILGSMVWGISKALHEETLMDTALGKYMNANLGEYHIPAHADIGELDVIFADEKDTLINELGTKGVGEIGLVGMPAAISNAIFHATGKRIYKLPIHFDELI